MSNDVFDGKVLSEKLSKLNNSQQSIESLSRWCISNRKKARQIVETWEKMFNSSQKEKCVSFLFLANDILQNSRRKGNEFVNEFWKVLPAALKHVYDNGDESGKKAANRLVDIWEDRKVFGSRVQSLKEELAANQIKDPAPQAVSNGKSPNPIKIVKKDAQSLRIKLAVGGFPEKIVSAFHCLHDECSNEESMLVNCNATVNSVERILKEIEATTSQGIQPGTGITDEMEEQEHALKQCVGQLEGLEAIRVTLVSLLKEAVQEQELQLQTLRRQLQIGRSRINEVGILRPKVLSHDHGVSAAPVRVLTDPQMTGELNNSALQPTSSLQIPSSQPIGSNQIPVHQVPQTPTQHTTAFAALAATDEESKKAAAAAVAAKLAASTSSAQMLTSVLSSLVAEEAASMNDSLRKVGFPANLSMFSPEKRQKLEQPSSGADAANLDSGSSPYFTPVQQPVSSNPTSQSSMQASLGPPPPPPPPPALLPANPVLNQYTQSAGMMLNMMPYGFGSNSLPPPPPLPSHVAMGLARPPAPQSSQPLQPLQQLSQQQNASGGFYRPPGIGLYGSSSQPSTPPVQRQ
ncbi:regulation of nuclear pre-mRNA domain-containing protein 1B-like [Chenopodium quinoa]|uniref:regulation of nuclear pre-mRNA domain-containing protein 1B-like n=1 Tax=Chenopodium quinoa TaxID=63459 RepID=UPI000B78C0A5|nr:regulation of nuclear pre-mRNA domain-containing protein 1B-like [Chenopodium quinoa]